MKADERHRLETNSLAAGTATLVDRAKHGQLVSPKVLGAVLAVALVGGMWWYVSATSRSASSTNWANFADIARTGGTTSLEEFVRAQPADTPGRLARLELARIKLGPDGIAKLPVRDAEQRGKAIASVEAARADLLELADEFRGDKTLESTCLLEAAEAELALVGIPKTPGGTDYRGTVEKAAELLRRAADVVGPTTPAGEAAIKRAGELEANKAQVLEVGTKLNSLLSPPPSLDPPKAPLGPIPTPAPPTAPKPPEVPPAAVPLTPPTQPKKDEPKQPEAKKEPAPAPVTPTPPTAAPAPTPATKK